MSTTTTNYSLVKPATTDKVDITVLDADLDTIDTQLYAKVSKGTLAINVKDYGAVGDGSTDNLTAFRNAMVQAIATNADGIYVPSGTYVFTATTNSIMLPLHVGVSIRGAGKHKTILKVKAANDPASPNNFKSFTGSNSFTTDDLTGMCISDLTFDYNTQNNPVVDVDSLGSGNRCFFMAPKGRGIRVERVDVINGDAKWVLELGGTSGYTAAAYRCDDAYIDINVYNFGINSAYHDSSAIWVLGDRAVVRGTFVAADTAPGAIAAVELHGNSYDLSVSVDGFTHVANLTGIDAMTSQGGMAHHCRAKNVMAGFTLWSSNLCGATDFGIDGLTICDNSIEINPDLWSGPGKADPPANFGRAGVTFADVGAEYNLPMANLKIVNNIFRFLPATVAPTVNDGGVVIIRAQAMTGSPQADRNIDISGNIVESPLASGITLDLKNEVDGLIVSNHLTRDPCQNGLGSISAKYATGILLIGKFFGFWASNINVTDTRATPVATSAVNMAGVSNYTPATGRQGVVDAILVNRVTAIGPCAVVGPSSGQGVYVRLASYGYYTPIGLFAYGSQIFDIGNGHTYIQTTASAGGSSWQVWSEITSFGVMTGGGNIDPLVVHGVPYISMLNTVGPPTAAPTARTGMTPFLADTNGKLWVYIGTSWQGIATA